MSTPVERARALVGRARRVVVLTGAGVSAESGVPTFRGAGGLWRSHRPEQLATPEAFARDPRTVWEWYAWRRGVVAGCAPNVAHLALARLALEREHVTLVTQNVDGLHHRAAEEVAGGREAGARAHPLEVHGAIHRDRCSACDVRSPGRTEIDTASVETLPRCEACGGLLRPDVVWFGEPLDMDVLGAAFAAAEVADLCLVIGTSSVVYPAAAVPEIALRAGAALIEINPEETPLSPLATVTVRASAGAVLPHVLAAATCGTSAEG
ncbi:MAG TPA: NAD-dependent protein deacylase [Longimicrobiales bacterium]|nr:NAD-dependent protein deacylase [Longimicrobiales bacterium]